MDGVDAARDRLCDPEFEVSAHYLIGQDGTVIHMVREVDRAWHAGAGAWGAIRDVNSASIGIELCNRGDHAFAVVQIKALIALIDDIRTRWSIPAHRVIGHSDMAPARKQDPGRLFPWDELSMAGQAVHRGRPVGPDLGFLQAAEKFGYAIPDDKRASDIILEAFRQRFRPSAEGPLDEKDIRILSDLAQTWPVDGETGAA